MARAGFRDHPKFRRLMRLLGIPEPYVFGLCGVLWEVSYAIGAVIGDEEDVEDAARWPGEPGKLVKALLACGGPKSAGLIEEVPGRPGVYQIHDYEDHVPDYVRSRARMRKYRGCEESAREQLRNSYATVTTNPTQPNPTKPRQGNTYTPEFENFWKEYPRKEEKQRAFTCWKARMKAGVETSVLIKAAQHYADYCRSEQTVTQYIKQPYTFLGCNEPYKDWLEPRVNGKPHKETPREAAARIAAERNAQCQSNGTPTGSADMPDALPFAPSK